MKILVIDIQAFKNILRQLKHLGLKCVKNPMRTSQRRFKGRIHRCAASLRRFYNQQNKSCLKKLVLTTCLDALWQKKTSSSWFDFLEMKTSVCEFVIWYFIEGQRLFIYFLSHLGVLEVWVNTKRLKRVQSFQRQALNEILMGSVHHLISNLPGNTTRALTRPACQPGLIQLCCSGERCYLFSTEPDQIYTQALLTWAVFILVKK